MSRPSPSRGSLAHGFIPQGIALGLYLSRAIAESSVTSWRLLVLLPLAAASISLGILLTSLLGRAGQRLSAHPGGAQLSAWPLLLLLGYVLCPWTSATVAWAVALFVAIMLLMLNGPILASGRPARRIPLLEMGVTLGALGLYVATLAPTVLPADAGEFQLVSAVLGIAHPPGYPLYTMLGKLFTLFPVSDMVYRVNLYGAVCGALTLAVIAHHVRRTTGSASAALVAAAALGTSATFWAQSTTANIRSLTALLTALSAHTMLRWGETQESKHLAAFGLVFGLGIGHHSSLALLAPPLAIYALCVSPWLVRQPRRWLPALLAFVLSFTVLLYLPIRSAMDPPFDPSPIRSLAGFLDHVLARGFGGDMLHYRTLPELAARFGVWLQIIRLQFGIPLTLAMFAALAPLAARRRGALFLLLGIWAMNTLSALTYRAPQTVEYLIPSYVALALILGEGLGTLLRAPLRRATGAAVVAVLTVLIALGGVGRYGSMATLHKDRSARAYAEAILRDAPPDTLVLSNWHRATVFWYLQQVEGLRRDVEVVYVYPEGDLPNESVWLRRIGEAIESRPVVVTNRYHGFALSDYRWAPFHEAWLVRADPLMEAPDYMTERVADLAGTVRLLGFQAEGNAVSPGDTLTVHVIWQPLRPLEDLSSFVQLLGPGGVLGQGDIAQPSSTYEVGEVRVDAYRFPVLLQALPGEYELITGFYRTTAAGWERLTTADGADHVMLSKVQVQLATEPPPMLRPQDARYASGVRLVGLDYDRSVAGQTRVYLHWQRPGTSALRMGPWVEPEGSEATVQLLAEGALVAQAALPPLAPGSAFTAVVDVPDTLQGLMLRLVAADGAPIPRLGPWHRRLGTDLQIALPQGAATYVPLGGEMIFLGLGDPPERATPGQTVSLRPRFVAARPLLADYSVSVGLSRPDLDWERKSDGTPARGAIPTLKWIRGWQVEDPRELALPPDAPPGPARVTLAVYDAFTLHPLQVLDDRLARQGLGTHLEPADIEIVHPRRALNRARLSLATAHQQPPLPAGRQGGSPRDRQPVIEFVALPTDAAALDRPRGLATIVALTFAAPDSRRRPRQTERGSVMEGGITMQLSCLPISLFQDIIGGRMSVGEWAQMGAEIGLDAIDISILFVPDRSPQALKRMRREIEASGIGLAMVTTYSDFTHPDPAQRKRELALEQEVIEVAAALGARFVRVTAGQAHPQTGREEGIAWAVEGIRKLHETSGALGPRLLFENHAKPGAWEYHDFAQPSDIFLEIVRATEDIGLGVNFDTGNAASFDDDPVGLLGQVIDRVVTIHAADTCVKGELRHCALGTGIAPFAEVFRFLHRAGWDNWICIEEEAHQGRKGIEADARFVREAWEAART